MEIEKRDGGEVVEGEENGEGAGGAGDGNPEGSRQGNGAAGIAPESTAAEKVVPREKKKPGGAEGARGGGGLQIPPDFRCPLSLELMSDPVIVASGQTYERAYIQQWLDQGNTTCPKTRQPLTHTNLIPNYTVKALIANWCEAHDVPLPEPTKADSAAVSLALRPVSASLAKANGDPDAAPSPASAAPPAGSNCPRAAPPSRPPSELRSMSMSHIGSRSAAAPSTASSAALSKRLLCHPRSLSERDFHRNGFQAAAADDHGEPSSPSSSSSFQQLQRVARSPRGGGHQHHLHHHHHRHPSADGDANLARVALRREKHDADPPGNEPTSSSSSPRSPAHHHHHHRPSSDDGQDSPSAPARLSLSSPYHSDASGELEKLSIAASPSSSAASPVVAFNEEIGSPARAQDRHGPGIWRRRGEDREPSLPRIIPSSPLQDSLGPDGNAQLVVDELVQDLQSDDVEVHRRAAAELRLLAKFNMENRITIANSGAIKPLVALLRSTDPKTQENAVTALLNLSINDNNKAEIAAAGAIPPLVNVLRVGSAQSTENAAATLFSLSVMDDNKVTIGTSGAIPPLVHLLINGSPRGKKDAATALFNLSIFHENKSRIVRAGAIKPLVELMADPAAGMVDKAVAVLANLATISEGRGAIGEEGGIPALVEVVEAGSQRGKENAAAALLQLCMNNNRHRSLVLQEGAIPPLVALSQSGTARAREKASALLRYFREQRHQVLGPRPAQDRQMLGQYYV